MLKINKLIALLFSLTLIAVIFEQAILSKTITLSPTHNNSYALYDDKAIGGNSKATLISSDKTFHWQCTMNDSPIPYPFCGFDLYLGEGLKKGVDLSEFTTMKLWLDYQGSSDTVRIALRNYNPLYSNEDIASTKFNALDIRKEQLTEGLVIDFRSFSVPSWWQLEHKLSHELTAPEFTNIVILDIESGSNSNNGHHEFKLQKIELIGQWLSTEHWYLSILLFWFTVSIGQILHRQLKLTQAIKQKEMREKELIKMNKILDVRSKKYLADSETDHLTGAYNRIGAESKIAIAQAEKRQDNLSFSIILFDIDHFKFINDQYGHDMGDKVLIQLSEKVQSNIRSTDCFARWGGEEFMIICRKTTLKTAGEIAEQLRELISSSIIVEDSMITASFGVAEVLSADKQALDDAFKKADIALYKAKQDGRNQVVLTNEAA